MFKQSLKHTWHTIWVTALVIFIILAVLFSVARIFSPFLARDRATIQRWMSVAIGQPVTIDNLEIDWQGLEPVLAGKHVVILDQAHMPLLKVDTLEVELSLLRSLFSGTIHLDKIEVSGANFTLKQNADGSITLIGLTSWAAPTATQDTKIFDEIMMWLLSQPRIEVNNIALTWQGNNNKTLAFRNMDLNLTNSLKQHRLWGQAELAQETPTQLAIIAEANGVWKNKQKFTTHFYVEAKDVLLPQWLQEYPAIKQGELDFELWGTWKNQLQTLHGIFNLDNLRIIGKQPLALTQLTGNILLQPDADGNWQLAGDLASHDSQADFGPLFRLPIKLNQFNAHIEAQKYNEGWLLQASQMTMRNEEMRATANMGLFLPESDESPTLSLLAAAHLNSNLPVKNYLPLTVLKPSLVNWLDNSIKSFDGVDSTLVINGKIADYPFDSNSGRFIVDSQVKNLKLDYYAGWPPLTNATGHLVFAERNMDYMLDAGKILSIPLRATHVYIPVIRHDAPAILHIDDDNIQSTLEEGFNFLQNSPLKKGPLATIATFSGTGPVTTQLHIAIPLEEGKQSTQVDGNIKLQNNTLHISQKDLQLQNINGQLNFTQDSLTAQNILAKLWGKPVTINVLDKPSQQVSLIYGDMKAIIAPQKNGWTLALTAPGIVGQIQLPNSKQQPMQANFKQLYLSDTTTNNKQQWSAKDAPWVSFIASDVRYGIKRLGQVKFQLVPQTEGVAIQNIVAASPAFTIAGNGSWRSNASQLNGALTSVDISSALASWGMPTGLTAKQSRIVFNLNWPDAVYNPSLKIMNGQISVFFSKGQLTDVGANNQVKMNIGRLLTSMSLQSFSRYLRLDFSNLTSRGFDFDTIKGDFTLRNGDAYTQNLLIKGPVADVTLSGRIGLAAENYDLTVTVKPNLTSGVPFIVALVNPIAGAASLLANTLLSPVVSTITSDTYRMSGSWSKPVVQKRS